MYKINLGYNSKLITLKNLIDPKTSKPKVIYSIPGYDSGNYCHPCEKLFNPKSIFTLTKNQAEEKYNTKFPVEIDETQQIFDKDIIDFSLNFGSTDVNLLKRLHEVELNENTVDYFIEKKERFIYPYTVSNEIYFLEDIPLPPDSVIKAAKEGLATIVFFYGSEGHTYTLEKLSAIIDFTKKLDVEVHYFHSNLKLGEAYPVWCRVYPDKTTQKLKIHRLSSFEIDPWFVYLDRTSIPTVQELNRNQFKIEKEHSLVKKIINPNGIRKFLVFNRRPRLFRTFIHAAIMSDDNLRKNSYTGIENNPDINPTISILEHNLDKIHQGQRTLNYIKINKEKYQKTGYKLDVNLQENQAFSFPLSFYYNSLISVVTETETYDNCVFFSEKIFKPILAMHPFIVVSSPYFLKTLRDEGYKTFDSFWDESYDLIEDANLRYSAILKLIEELNLKSTEELTDMYFSMSSILQHNYSHFLHNDRHLNFLNTLKSYSQEKSVNLI